MVWVRVVEGCVGGVGGSWSGGVLVVGGLDLGSGLGGYTGWVGVAL